MNISFPFTPDHGRTDYARNAGREFAESLTQHGDNCHPMLRTDDLPDGDYIDLRQRFGAVTPDMEAAYREGFNDAILIECAYCHAEVVDVPPPATDDNEAWLALAAEHASGCEWIRTRAHRIEA